MLTIFGAASVSFMMLMDALERRGPGFILAFASRGIPISPLDSEKSCSQLFPT